LKIKAKIPGTRHYFSIEIAETKEAMLKEKRKFAALTAEDNEKDALFFPLKKYTVSKKTNEKMLAPCVGNIYFNQETTHPIAVLSTILHASIHADRTAYDNDRAMFGKIISDKEKRLIKTYQDLLKEVIKVGGDVWKL